MTEIETHIQGIPCSVVVTHYESVASTYWHDGDCGLLDMDWYVVDRKGYNAPWLERKLTERDRSRIEDEIASYMEG